MSGAALATLRKQVAESKSPIPARRVAKLLVDKQVLTPAIAQRLLAAASKPASSGSPAPAAKGTQPKPRQGTVAARGRSRPRVAAGRGASAFARGLAAVGAASPLDALVSDPSLAAAVERGQSARAARTPKEEFLPVAFPATAIGRPSPQSNMPWVWIGAAAAVLLVLVVVTVWLLNRPNPEALLEPADARYQKGSYAEAIEGYDGFLSYFPRHARLRHARVRRGLAELRLAFAEKTGRRSAAVETAKPSCPRSVPKRNSTPRRAPFSSPLLPRPPSRWPWRARATASPRVDRPGPGDAVAGRAVHFPPRTSRWSGSAASRPPWP